MRAKSLVRISWFALRASTALALTVAPYHVMFDGAIKTVASIAHAEGEGGGSGGGGKGGKGGGDDGGGDNNGSNSTGTGASTGHVNPSTGDKVKVQGNTIEVVYPDGIAERIENGRFKMKDALGRTIIDRAATAKDLKRLEGL